MGKSEHRRNRKNQKIYADRRAKGKEPVRQPQKEQKNLSGRAQTINAIALHLIKMVYHGKPGVSSQFIQ
jgi:hypothetical protein